MFSAGIVLMMMRLYADVDMLIGRCKHVNHPYIMCLLEVACICSPSVAEQLGGRLYTQLLLCSCSTCFMLPDAVFIDAVHRRMF